MSNIINNILSALNPISLYLSEHHILITMLTAAGTLLTALNGMRNSAHLREQANIQRQIETNRYNLQLFNARTQAFNEFKESGDKIIRFGFSDDVEDRISKLAALNDICLSLYAEKGSNPLKTLRDIVSKFIKLVVDLKHTNMEIASLQNRFKFPFTEIKNFENLSISKRTIIMEDLEERICEMKIIIEEGTKQANTLLDDIGTHYRLACDYMVSRMEVPQNASETRPTVYRQILEYLKSSCKYKFSRR